MLIDLGAIPCFYLAVLKNKAIIFFYIAETVAPLNLFLSYQWKGASLGQPLEMH